MLIKNLIDPQPLRGSWRFANFILTLNLDAQGAFAFTGLTVLFLGMLIGSGRVVLLSLYQYCLRSITSDQPVKVNHGDTIAEVLRNIRSEPVEYLAIFDPQGRKVEEVTNYSTNTVHFSSEGRKVMQQHGGYTEIHNHPNSRNGFSPNDIGSAICCRASRAIVIAQDLVYTLELTPECWELDSTVVRGKINEAFKHRMNPAKKITADEWSAFTLGINAMLAEQYGMKLTVERFENCQYLRSDVVATTHQQATEPSLACNQSAKLGGSWRTKVIDLLKKICDID